MKINNSKLNIMNDYLNYKWMRYAGRVYGRVCVYAEDGRVLQTLFICPSLQIVRDAREWISFFDEMEALQS